MSGVVVMETLRRHVTSVPYICFVILAALVATGSALATGNVSSWQGLTYLLILILGAQLIGPEFSAGTLQLVIAKPVNRSTYLLSRVAGVVLAGWAALWLPFAIGVVARLLNRGVVDWTGMLAAPVSRSQEMLLACALLAFFGSFTRSYFNIALYLVLNVGISASIGILGMLASGGDTFGWAGRFVASHPQIAAVMRVVDQNLFPDPPTVSFDWRWIALVLSNAAVALFCACFLFSRREVPYGAD
jgi:ABC-type transport system involved in multi-copper enzyme maturation permease subunit